MLNIEEKAIKSLMFIIRWMENNVIKEEIKTQVVVSLNFKLNNII